VSPVSDTASAGSARWCLGASVSRFRWVCDADAYRVSVSDEGKSLAVGPSGHELRLHDHVAGLHVDLIELAEGAWPVHDHVGYGIHSRSQVYVVRHRALLRWETESTRDQVSCPTRIRPVDDGAGTTPLNHAEATIGGICACPLKRCQCDNQRTELIDLSGRSRSLARSCESGGVSPLSMALHTRAALRAVASLLVADGGRVEMDPRVGRGCWVSLQSDGEELPTASVTSVLLGIAPSIECWRLSEDRARIALPGQHVRSPGHGVDSGEIVHGRVDSLLVFLGRSLSLVTLPPVLDAVPSQPE